MATKKAMKLVDGYTGMECKTCGSVHFASLKRGGGYYRGSWQCSNETCPTKIKNAGTQEPEISQDKQHVPELGYRIGNVTGVVTTQGTSS